jgi:hypothetical protein
MLVFVEGGKPENPEKNPRSNGENQQQTQLTNNSLTTDNYYFSHTGRNKHLNKKENSQSSLVVVVK